MQAVLNFSYIVSFMTFAKEVSFSTVSLFEDHANSVEPICTKVSKVSELCEMEIIFFSGNPEWILM